MASRRERKKIIQYLKNQGMKNPNQFDVINNQLGGRKMKETIIKMQRGPFPKKYTAIVRNKKTRKTRKIHWRYPKLETCRTSHHQCNSRKKLRLRYRDGRSRLLWS